MFSRAFVRLGWLVSFGGLLGAVSCRADHPDEHEASSVIRSAVFTNGDLESDAIGASPTGWTVVNRQNKGITDTRPAAQTLASLNLMTGGYLATQVVGGATESQTDPDLGATASFRYPKYGTRAAVVNYLNSVSRGNNYNANVMSQTMTTTNSDVDAADNKIHIRFAVAPVLESGGHPYNQQPYYYVALENITKGTTMYQDFNASAQAGVPWKIVGSIYYTDWQLVDIAPGNAGLAVGDQVKLTVIAAGCSQSGHFGRAYVDGIGSTVPGLYTSATGPASANQGTDITYVVTYRNGGTGAASGSSLRFVIPTGTTYKSNTLPSACTAPAVGATGTVTCALGTLSPGSSGTFNITVNINSGTAGTTVTAGDYSIQATSVSALLGPKVLTSVTTGVTYADLAITKTDDVAAIGWGQAVTYLVRVSNAGPGAATGVTVTDTMPAQLTGVAWTCAGTAGGTCTASGTGNINTTASLPVGAAVTYTVTANVVAGTGSGSMVNTATATVGSGTADPDTSNNTAVDTDSIGVLRTLTVNKVNANGGSVTSVPASISCGTSCTTDSGSFVDGTSVVLTAAPVSGAAFTTWGGACASAGSTPTCALTITADTVVSAVFTPPPTVNITSGNNQGAAKSTAFGAPLTVQVLDSNAAPISGATVLFSVPGSGASASLSATTVTTNASGVATVNATANATAGAYSISAGLSGTPITATFSVWNYGTATTIAVVSGSGQSATAGAAFGAPLVALVTDAASQPVVGATVTFAAVASGGGASATLGGATATTNGSGRATATATANAVPGSYVVTASTSGAAAAASFNLTNNAGSPSQIVVTGGGTQSATVGTAFAAPLLVTVKDAFGSPLVGVTVTFAAPASGASASLSANSATTNTSGQASVTATANTAIGTYSATASVSGVGMAATFALTNTAGAAASVMAVSGGAQTTIAGNAFGAPLVVIVKDSYGNPLSGVTVTFSAPASGASGTLSAPTAVTNGAGQATTTVTANATAGTYTVSVTVGGVASPASFSLTNTAALAISPASTTVPPNGTEDFDASGGSGTGFTFSIMTNRSGATITPSTGVYHAGGTPNVNDVIVVTDSLGATATATVMVGSGVSLDPPTTTAPPKGAVVFTATGGVGSGYVFSVTSNLSGGSIDAAGRYRAGPVGNVTDVVSASDALGNQAMATIQVSAPVTLSSTATTSPPRGTLTFTASGGSGTGVVFALSASASGGSINASTGVYTAGATPLVTDVVTATDSLGNVASATVQVGPGVSLTPNAPAAAPQGAIHFVASGGSGLGYSFAIVTNGSGGTIDPGTGNYVAGSSGSAVDLVRATDSLGNVASVSVTVGAGLTLTPESPTAAPGQIVGFSGRGGGGTGYHYALTVNGSGGVIDAATGTYTAGLMANTVDTIVVTDLLGNRGTTTVHVGSAVTLSPPVLTVAPGGTGAFSVSGGSGGGYTFSLATNASGGTIDPTTGAYTAGPAGGVTDVVRVTDSLGRFATAQITVTESLTATPSTYFVAPQQHVALVVSGGAAGYTFALVSNGSGGTIDATTGDYTAGATGDSTDTILVSDGNGVTTS
ncbi:MAG: Ig-like domain-containing protein, partial [Pseudomonadota bacterium]